MARRAMRLGPGLLGGTAVLLVAVTLYGSALRPFGTSLSTSPHTAGGGVSHQLLVLRPESSPTGMPVNNIWIIRSDGTGLRRMTSEPTDVLDFAISPDATQLVLVARDGPIATALWRIGLDGTRRTRLTPATDAAVYTDPAWSPAGDLLLYVRRDLITPGTLGGGPGVPSANVIPEVGVPRVWAMTPDGRPLRRVYGQADETAEGPVWSPEGSTVVFREVSERQRATNLIISDLAAEPVKVPSGIVTRMTWSPDGRWLAYDEAVAGGTRPSRIMLVRADGSGRRPLLSEQPDPDTAPAWSPDGTVLAFVRRARDTPPSGAVGAVSEVWTAAPDGRIGHRLFGGEGRGCEDLRWSPDGGMLAATRYTVVGAAERGVWVADADGTRARELVKNARHAAWVP